MAVALRALGETDFTTATASPTVSKPSSPGTIQDGDVMLMIFATNTTTTVASGPIAGWSRLFAADFSSDGTFTIWWKVHNGDGSSWTMTNIFGSSSRCNAEVIAYSGADQYATPQYNNGTTSGTSVSGPSVTPNYNNSMFVHVAVTDPGTGTYAGTPDSSPVATERRDSKNSGGSSYEYMYIQEYLQSTKAALALDITGLTSDDYGHAQVVLAPAGTSLTVNDVASATAVDNVVIQQVAAINLTVNSVASATAGDAAGFLPQVHNLTVASCASASAVDSLVLVKNSSLSIADLVSSTAVEAPAVSKETTLTIYEVSSASAVDAPPLTKESALVINDVASSTAVDGSLVLQVSGGTDLSVADIASATAVDAISYFPQILKPNTDTFDGNWTNESGNQTNLFESVNDANPVDSDYIQSEYDPTSSPVVVKLETGSDPQTSSGHIIRYRPEKYPDNSQSIGYTVQLRQDYVNESSMGTLIAEWTDIDIPDDLATVEHTLTAAQANSITNYGSLYVRIIGLQEPGVYRLYYYGGGSDVGAFGDCNALIGKFTPDGKVKWMTLLGGPNYTRIYGMVVDSSGNVYVAGRCGPGLHVTAGVPQPLFAGTNEPTSYGYQNAFVAKLGPNGNLIWATYLGTNSLLRDLALSPDETFLALPFSYYGNGTLHAGIHPNCAGWAPAALSGAYASEPQGTTNHCGGAAKMSTVDGSVSYATYLPGNAKVSSAESIMATSDGGIIILTSALATDLEVTAGCRSKAGSNEEFYLCKFNSNLSDIVWGTYLGCNTGDLYISTHNLVIDDTSAFVVGQTAGTNMPTTTGAYQESYPTGATNTSIVFRCRLSDGVLTACTYFGGTNGTSNMDGLQVASDGDVWIALATACNNMPVTSDAFQLSYGGGANDGFIVALSNDLTAMHHASYLGGSGDDQGRCSWFLNNRMLVGGQTNSSNFPTKNPYQGSYSGSSTCDAIITIFDVSKIPIELVYSTYWGGSLGTGSWTRDVKIGPDGYCYVAGGTQADNFPTHD